MRKIGRASRIEVLFGNAGARNFISSGSSMGV